MSSRPNCHYHEPRQVLVSSRPNCHYHEPQDKSSWCPNGRYDLSTRTSPEASSGPMTVTTSLDKSWCQVVPTVSWDHLTPRQVLVSSGSDGWDDLTTRTCRSPGVKSSQLVEVVVPRASTSPCVRLVPTVGYDLPHQLVVSSGSDGWLRASTSPGVKSSQPSLPRASTSPGVTVVQTVTTTSLNKSWRQVVPTFTTTSLDKSW